MDFIQLIPFNPSNGGTTPNLCLANVSAGYGIGNKYGSAWEAWENTQQHPDRNIPAGLAVPIYYSYTTTIDDVTANYGHINVQLPNGTVWSDGNIYASIDDYMSEKLPKFVGWGESVNDYKIIQGDIAMGVQIVGNPTICSWGPERRDIFAKGSDGGLWHTWYDTGKQNPKPGWAGVWEKLPGGILADPDATSPGENIIDVVGTGAEGHLYHWWLKPEGGWGLEDKGVIE